MSVKNPEALEALKKKVFNKRKAFLNLETGDEIQLVVKENNRRPGKPIFVLANGKVGFPSLNSMPANLGDTIKGTIKIDNENVFFVEITEVVEKAVKEKS